MPEEIDEERYAEIVDSDETWVLDFWAAWCGPCKTMAPIFESVADEFDSIHFGKVDVEKHQQLATQHGVRSIPTFLVVKNGEEVDRAMGAMSEADFADWVDDTATD